jgi:cold shock CspA family protein
MHSSIAADGFKSLAEGARVQYVPVGEATGLDARRVVTV